MGEEINKLSPSSSTANRNSEDPAVEMSSLMSDDPLSLVNNEDPSASSPSSPALKIPHHAGLDADDCMAGIYLGIHNIFATIPQFLATFISMIVFSILEPGQSPELAAGGGGASSVETPAVADDQMEGKRVMGGLSGTAVCLAIGAVFQVVAAAQSLRMRRY